MKRTDSSSEEAAIAALRRVLSGMPRRADVWVRASENSEHVGAVLAECALQAGLNYEAVVVPRVKRFIAAYPMASTTSGLLGVLAAKKATDVLGLRNARKCQTFRDLAALLKKERIEIASELREWLESPASRVKLLAVPGVKVKTAAYLRLLAGLPAIAIDVHLRRAAADVGIERDDADLERLFTIAAEREGLPLALVDGSLWQDGADRSRKRPRRRAT